jgi:predicted small lipoprotein YifL
MVPLAFRSEPTLDRRTFSLAMLAAGLAVGVSACGRRGPLEPPPYTEQGRQWQRRQGRNPDGTRREPGRQPAEGSVQEGLQRDRDARTTVDVEADVERNRVEGQARAPSDPTQSEPGGLAPSVSPQGLRRRPPGIVPPKQPFILDPLL